MNIYEIVKQKEKEIKEEKKRARLSEEWVKETQRRANLIAKHFTAEEMQIIDDFIQTAKRLEEASND